MTPAPAAAVKNTSIVMENKHGSWIRRTLALLLMVIGFFHSNAQTSDQSTMEIDPGIQKVVDWYRNVNRENKILEGWTIQILSTRDRREMEQERDRFLYKYPEYRVRQSFEEPFYRLKVGSFTSKLEALALRQQLQKQYRSAVLVKEEINKEDYF